MPLATLERGSTRLRFCIALRQGFESPYGVFSIDIDMCKDNSKQLTKVGMLVCHSKHCLIATKDICVSILPKHEQQFNQL